MSNPLCIPKNWFEKDKQERIQQAISLLVGSGYIVFKKEDLEKLVAGVVLEDGKTQCDKASFIEGGTEYEAGVELHSGKNRIVRRLFEEIGYKVIKLDRVQFSGLTKKDLPRGMFRHLTEKEVAFLKMSS
jgi:23S rRNA pseudouridine2605 synthase